MTQLPPTPEQPGTGVPTCYRHPGRESYIRCQRCDRSICPDCMRDAAVGFQCPDCVAEGHRSTRQARTAYGGRRSANPGATTMALIGVNLAVWVAILATGGSGSRLVDLLALRTRGLCRIGDGGYDVPQTACTGGGTWLPGFVDGAYWQVLTSGFAHVTLLHVAFNMFALYVLGPQLEHALGRARFLSLYLLSLLAGSALVLWAAPQYSATLGASGAVYGLFAALLVTARKVGGDIRQLGLLMLVNVVITFAVPGISWQGHLGGFLAGLVVAVALVHAPRGPRRTTFQVSCLVAVAVVVAAAVLLRAATLV